MCVSVSVSVCVCVEWECPARTGALRLRTLRIKPLLTLEEARTSSQTTEIS